MKIFSFETFALAVRGGSTVVIMQTVLMARCS